MNKYESNEDHNFQNISYGTSGLYTHLTSKRYKTYNNWNIQTYETH